VATNLSARLLRFSRLAVVTLVLLMPAVCHAQSCALCYTQAASSGRRLVRGLRTGILVLIVPPMFLSVGITVLAYRKRNQFQRSNASHSARTEW
jgi:hypothetical protein